MQSIADADIQLSKTGQSKATPRGDIAIQFPQSISADQPFEFDLEVTLSQSTIASGHPLEMSLFFLKLDERDPAKLSLKLPHIDPTSLPSGSHVRVKIRHRLSSLRKQLDVQAGEYMLVAALGPHVGGPMQIVVQD